MEKQILWTNIILYVLAHFFYVYEKMIGHHFIPNLMKHLVVKSRNVDGKLATRARRRQSHEEKVN